MLREWLREVESSPKIRMSARQTLHNYRAYWGESEIIRCPGCGDTEGLVFLEIRNWEASDAFKIPHVIPVCSTARNSLFWRYNRDMVFGVSALVNQVPWTCAKKDERQNPQPQKARGNHQENLQKWWGRKKEPQKPPN